MILYKLYRDSGWSIGCHSCQYFAYLAIRLRVSAHKLAIDDFELSCRQIIPPTPSLRHMLKIHPRRGIKLRRNSHTTSPSLLQADAAFLLLHYQLLQVLTGHGTLRPLEAWWCGHDWVYLSGFIQRLHYAGLVMWQPDSRRIFRNS